MFEKILFSAVLEGAIRSEEEAYELYSRLSSRPHSKKAAELLSFLAGEELIHRMQLEELKKNRDLSNLELKRIRHGGNLPAEAPEQGNGELKSILSIALRNETKAYERYRRLGKDIRNKSARDLFSLLAGEEKEHIRKITEFISNAKD